MRGEVNELRSVFGGRWVYDQKSIYFKIEFKSDVCPL